MPHNAHAAATGASVITDPDILAAANLVAGLGGKEALNSYMQSLETAETEGRKQKGLPLDTQAQPQQQPAGQQQPAAPAAQGKSNLIPKEGEGEEDVDDDNPFTPQKPTAAMEFKSIDDFNKHIKDKYSINDLGTFLGSANKWREGSKKAEESNAKLDRLVNDINSMPWPVQEAIRAVTSGGDYASAFNNAYNRIDYAKPFAQQDIAKVAQALSPGLNVSNKEADDYIDLNNPSTPAAKAVYTALEDKFKINQEKFTKANGDALRHAETRAADYRSSVDASVSKLTTTLPKIKSKEIEDLTKLLAGGNFEESLFYDAHGNLLPDAATRAWYGTYGQSYVKTLMTTINSQNERIDQLMSRGGDQPRSNNGQQNNGNQQQAAPADDSLFAKTLAPRKNMLSITPLKD